MPSGETVVIEVADSGGGVPDDLAAHISERGVSGSTGLGLALAPDPPTSEASAGQPNAGPANPFPERRYRGPSSSGRKAWVNGESTAEPLVDRLRSGLPALVDEVLREADVAKTLEHVHPESARLEVRNEVHLKVLDESDDLLRTTNPEIARLRAAEEELALHEQPSGQPAGAQDEDRGGVRRRRAYFGLGLWLAMVYPLAIRELWTPLTSMTGIIPALAVLGTGAGLVFSVADALISLVGRPQLPMAVGRGAGWVSAFAAAMSYIVLLWWLWLPTTQGVGRFWSWVIWIAAAILTLLICFVGILASLDTASTNDPDYRLNPYGRKIIRQQMLIMAVSVLIGVDAATIVWQLSAPEWLGATYGAGSSLAVVIVGTLWVRAPRWAVAAVSSLVQNPGQLRGLEWNRERERLKDRKRLADQAWLTAARKVVRESVLRNVHEVIRPPFATELGDLDRSGLGQMRAGERVVSTEAFGRLHELIKGISGGAVGMAGPRGAGKSTLLEAYRAGKFLEPGQEHIALLETVPVKYDAREFVLHLFAMTCEQVAEFCDEQLRDKARRGLLRSVAEWRRLGWALVVVLGGLLVGLIGGGVIGVDRIDLGRWLRTQWWPLIGLLTVGGAALVLTRQLKVIRARRADPKLAERDLGALRRYAWELRNDIQFQQKHTSGWSGKVSLPFGMEIGRSGARELTRQAMSYPEVVRTFRDFLETTIECVKKKVPAIATPSVVIIMDELDKMLVAQDAQDFVNEIKAMFNLDVDGFLFLVSVSEDALASFERRGMPVRDAFDSAFDAIFRLEYLRLADARSVLSGRILRMPEPFICLCHCMAGGLPRELVRMAREIVAHKGTLAEVCRDVVANDLRSKVAGLRTIIARRAPDDVWAGELMRHIEKHAVADVKTLFAAVSKPAVTEPSETELLRLQLEMYGYLYFCGTVLEVFCQGFTEQDMAKGRDSEGDASFDTLTSVRQLFTVNARLAWLTVSAFRSAWGKAPIGPPGAGSLVSFVQPVDRPGVVG